MAKKEPTSYLYINKKRNKVKMRGTPKVMGLLGGALQIGIPFGYLAYKYDLFTFKQAGYAITGWGVVVLVSVLIIFRNKIKDTLKEADSALSETYRRSKLGVVMILLSLIVVLTNYFVEAFVVLFLIVSASTFVSLPLYKPYDEVAKLQKEMQSELKRRNIENDLNRIEVILKK
jgi:hypothetical protein